MFLDTKAIQWKLYSMETIPVRYIHKAFGKSFKFHSNLHIPSDLICTFLSFYQDIITSWCKSDRSPPHCPQQFLHNIYGSIPLSKLKIVLSIIRNFNQINYVCDFFDRNGNLKSWINIVHEYKIKKNIF